jgi:hypothetical protein
MNKKYSFFQTLIIIVLVNLIVFGAVWAWTEPNNPPPGGNVAVPINTGNIYQEKLGGLWLLNGLGVDNKLIVDGNVGIGTTNPGAKLHIAGLSSDKAIRMGEYGTNGLSSTNFVGTHYYWNTDNLQIGLRDYGSDRKDAVFNIEQSSDNFRFQVAGNDKVFIKGTGNVGIGTTGPGAKLEVAGQVKITGGSPGAGKVLTSNAAGLASWQAAAGGIGGSGTTNYIPRWTGGTTLGNSVIYQSGSNIGIGTTGPNQKLDVVGNIEATGSIWSHYGTIGNLNTGSEIGQQMEYGSTAVATLRFDSDRWRLYTGGTGGGGEIFTVQQGGNVGIGTTNPGAKLEVAGQVKITGGSPGAGKVLTSNAAGLASWQAAAGGDSYWTQSGSNLYPDNTGWNVGIGTTNPLRPLTISRSGYLLMLEGSGTANNRRYSFYQDSNRLRLIRTNDNNSYGGDIMTWRGDGNVGIGTTNPGAKLEVAGQVKITGGSPGAGKVLTSNAAGLASWQAAAGGITCADCDARFVNTTGDTMSGNLDIPNNALFIGSGNARIKFYDSGSRFYMAPYDDGAWQWGREFGYNADTNRWYFDNDVQAHAFYYSSDKAFKTDILHLEDGLDKILSLQGVSFNWKENNEPSIGLIAQDVEKIFPEAVSGKEGEKAVNYGVLVAPLIEAVKEQQKEIEYLKTEIEELKGIIK